MDERQSHGRIHYREYTLDSSRIKTGLIQTRRLSLCLFQALRSLFPNLSDCTMPYSTLVMVDSSRWYRKSLASKEKGQENFHGTSDGGKIFGQHLAPRWLGTYHRQITIENCVNVVE
jgi:hypothetical protein